MPLRKLQDVVVYRDPHWYSTFPSCVTLKDGTVLVAFRRAPERRERPGGRVTHADPNSQLMAVRSKDGGLTWETQPRLIFAHPSAGNQDPCMTQLADGSILCSTFSWQLLPTSTQNQPGIYRESNGWPMVNLGVSVLRSTDGGVTWPQRTIIDPPKGFAEHFQGVPNRGAIRGRAAQLPSGRVLLPIYAEPTATGRSHALVYASDDGGLSFKQLATIASDERVDFHEPALYRTPMGKVVAFLRTANLEGYLAVTESKDEGKTWSAWRRSKVWGHPFTAVATADSRVLSVYGYRRKPFGVRARLLDAECDHLDDAEETILRDDGADGDLGYPWATLLPDGKMLVVHYHNTDGRTRFIAGSILEVT